MTAPPNIGLYTTLGLKPTATPAEIRAAYRRKAKTLHPDAGGSEEAFQLLTLAHSILSDPDRRAEYDATGRINTQSVDNERAAVLEVLAQVAQQVLAANTGGDFLAQMALIMDHKIAEGEQMIAANKASLKKLEDTLKRLKRKTGDGALIMLLEQQRNSANTVIAGNTSVVEKWKTAQSQLKDYTYDMPKQQRQGQSYPDAGNAYSYYSPFTNSKRGF